MPELLSLCIPTYNRSEYLREILSQIGQGLESELETGLVRVYISDNGSADNTKEVAATFLSRFPQQVYQRHPQNIGMNENFVSLFEVSQGRYFWLVGDDELFEAESLSKLVKWLKNDPSELIICGVADENFGHPAEFASYRTFVRYFARRDAYMLLKHSLISCNIIRRDCFDGAVAVEKIPTFYTHMYAMAAGLARSEGRVAFYQEPSVRVREQRAPINDNWPDLVVSWLGFYSYLAKLTKTPRLALWSRVYFFYHHDGRALRLRRRVGSFLRSIGARK
jgi:glycosyltransferase involved in cell wall biosynthesis